MSLCETCKNGVFCPTWGEQKCKALGCVIHNPDLLTSCGDYKKLGKDEEPPKCHCEFCYNGREEEE